MLRYAALIFGFVCALPLQAESLPGTLTPKQAAEYFNNPAVLWLDVRSDREWQAGHLQNAQHLPYKLINKSSTAQFESPEQPIIAYCAAGVRAKIAQSKLNQLGFSNVSAVVLGGYGKLKKLAE